MKRVALVTALFGALSIGYAAGAIESNQADARPETTYDHLEVFGEVLDTIQSRYVEEIDDEELVYGAIEGMVDQLDPHSRFMDPEAFQAMRDDTRGEYVGVGMEVRQTDEGVEIGEVFEGGPAFDAGLQTGDLILRIDDEAALDFTTDDAVRRLRGQRGEGVEVEIQRPETAETIAFDLVRDRIRMVAVEESLPIPGYGVIELRQFQSDVGNEVRAAIDRLQNENGGELDGLVLDLRGNPGGLLSEAIHVSDVFLTSGTIVSTAGRDPSEAESWSAQRNNTRYRGPLVVLVNGDSASASEIVAGALQDNDRAVIIGTQSFGKGSVQSIIELGDGSGLKLTVSLYYTPLGRSIQGAGITPDIEVEAGTVEAGTESPREADLEGSLAAPILDANERDSFDSSQISDRQLRAALEQLHAFAIFARSQP